MLSSLRKKCLKNVSFKIIAFITVVLLYYLGVFPYLFALDYDTEFSYPLHQNIVDCSIALSKQQNSNCPVINSYDYDFLIKNSDKCKRSEAVQLVLIVKSATHHFERRAAIRSSWGYEGRFADVIIRRVFIIGVDRENASVGLINDEHNQHGDIVLANFHDTYFNNTIKTMLGFKWAVTHCPNARFYLFSDDDMYISIKNVMRFVRNPAEYPRYLESAKHPAVSKFMNKGLHYELPTDVKLLAGFVFVSSPHRHQCSKWYVSLDEYPYNKWPPYVSAGSYIVSYDALRLMYYASFFTKHFRLDDIYVGLLAKKMNLEPFHCSEFNIFEKPYNPMNFKYVLSSHGHHSDGLLNIWLQQKTMGNA